MLEEKDLQAIAKLITASEERTSQKIIEVEERMTQKITEVEKRIDETEELLLDEIGRVNRYLDAKITNLEKKLDDIEQYYKIRKLDDGNISLLFSITEDHNKRITALETGKQSFVPT